MPVRAVQLLVRAYGARGAGRADLPPHALRHTCATHLVRDGAGIVYVQRVLGHRSLATTQIYTRVSPADMRETVRASHPRA